jgi:purine-nucleoside phosphorylase
MEYANRRFAETALKNEFIDLPPEALEAAAAISRRWSCAPRAGLILGTGLGNLAGHINRDETFAYEEIPHFPRSTALSHRGQLVCGHLAGTPVVAMEGRCHRYEGYSLARLTHPVYTMRALGIDLLILSNASGGLNPLYHSGDVMVIEDHINLMFWKQPSEIAGQRASDRRKRSAVKELDVPSTQRTVFPYDPVLIEQAMAVARRENFVAHRGVYVVMTGPNYETRAEYRFLRKIGGDAVGMSTVPEAVAAASCGLRTLALSTITNVARPDAPQVTLGQDVVRAAEMAEPNVRKIVLDVIAEPWTRKTLATA